MRRLAVALLGGLHHRRASVLCAKTSASPSLACRVVQVCFPAIRQEVSACFNEAGSALQNPKQVHSKEIKPLPGGMSVSISCTPATRSSCAPVAATTDAGSVARVIAASRRWEYRPPPTRAASAVAYMVPLDALCVLCGLPASLPASCPTVGEVGDLLAGPTFRDVSNVSVAHRTPSHHLASAPSATSAIDVLVVHFGTLQTQ